MKKITALLLSVVLTLSLAACGGKSPEKTKPETATMEAATTMETTAQTEEVTTAPTETEPPASLIKIMGVFYGNFGVQKDMFDYFYAPKDKDDLIVFFEYANDDENRSMPGGRDTGLVTVSLGEGDPIPAVTNSEKMLQMGKDSVIVHKAHDFIDRYTGYHYALAYGNLPGGAEPVQMYARFFVDPNSLDGRDKITLDVDGQAAVFSSSDIQKIASPDEILSMKGDYETEQQLAAFKWRMDKAFMVTTFLASTNSSFGSPFSSMSEMMRNIFAENTGWGVTIFQNSVPDTGFREVDGIVFDTSLRKELPSFDLSVILEAYPDQAEAINAYINNVNTLAKKIVTSGTSARTVGDLINTIRQQYAELCAEFDLTMIQYN